MSAAIWTEPGEAADAHPGLGRASIAAAALAGRARPSRIPIVLHIWGEDEEAASRAESAVSTHPDHHRWHVVETRRDVAATITVDPHDRNAVASRARYGWAWVAYRASAAKRRTNG
jgi:hypothetical protein